VYKYASGNKVIKPFIPTDWRFFNEKGWLMTADDLLEGNHATPKKPKVTFRIKKNHEKDSPSL
jgi:hypothetical protein